LEVASWRGRWSQAMKEERQAQLEAQIAQLETVSTAPVILQPLLELLRQSSDDIRTEKVVELVSRDGAIAAQCVRMANSPLFAHRPVETIRAAILTLGIEKVRSLVFGLCMNRSGPKNKWVLDANSFWRHSLGCALVNQMLAQQISYPEPEKAFWCFALQTLGFFGRTHGGRALSPSGRSVAFYRATHLSTAG
jgi:HD-like signal output (HDOD) protein